MRPMQVAVRRAAERLHARLVAHRHGRQHKQASDGAGGLSTQNFTIHLTNVAPTTPTDSDAGANTVTEEADNGTLVGITANATDPNGPAVIYSLTNDAGGRFQIDASSGAVSVKNGTLLNFESATSHTITVQATDGAGGASTQSLVIQVGDVNDRPTISSINDVVADEFTTRVTLPFQIGDADTPLTNLRMSAVSSNSAILTNNRNDSVYEKANANFTVSLVGGTNQLSSTATGTEKPAGIEQLVLIGGDGNNKLDATTATISVVLIGGKGDDTVLGGSANDTLMGGSLADSVAAIDTVKDTLKGNGGLDTFQKHSGGPDVFQDQQVSELILDNVFSGLPSWLDAL